jgi:hypothetical protein
MSNLATQDLSSVAMYEDRLKFTVGYEKCNCYGISSFHEITILSDCATNARSQFYTDHPDTKQFVYRVTEIHESK